MVSRLATTTTPTDRTSTRRIKVSLGSTALELPVALPLRTPRIWGEALAAASAV